MSSPELTIPPLKVPRRKPLDRGEAPVAVYSSPGRSTVHHPLIVVVVLVIGLIAGGLAGHKRAPVWTAQSRIIVGTTLSLTNLAATPGLVAAETAVASNYSRLVGTPAVTAAVTARLGHPQEGTLSATPVPQSSIILVNAKGPTQAAATRLATAGQGAIVATVNTVNHQSVAANAALLAQYQTLAQQMAQETVTISGITQQQNALQASINGLQDLVTAGTATHGDVVALTAEQQQLATLASPLVAANAALNINTLAANTLETQYQANYSPSKQAEEAITPLGAATPTGSNRRTNLEIGLLAGGVGGLIIGMGLASVSDIVADRRRHRRAA